MPPEASAHDPRVAAARVIAAVLSGQSLNQALPPALDRVEGRDRALLQELCYGSLRQGPRLQSILGQMLDKPLRKKDNDVQALLMAGLYQLEYMRIPPHAAVAATVEATRGLRKKWASGMANAVLRRYQRQRDELCAALDSAATQAHPQWLYDKIRQQWPGHCEQIIAANNQPPPMSLRVNSSRGSREDYLAVLAHQGIDAVACAVSKYGIQLARPRDVQELPGFGVGEVSVQDEAAQLAAPLLDAASGERVLDACAAPGGKTCHILELQPQLSQLVAMDVERARLQRVKENLERLELRAELVCADAGAPPDTLAQEAYDRILVDAPCSASGVIRRHPDVKFLRRPGDISGLAKQQLHILRGLWPLLKPGGCLLYVTCSVFNEENGEVVQRFLDEQANAGLSPLNTQWGVAALNGRQLLPTPDGPDGLYFSLLTKQATVS